MNPLFATDSYKLGHHLMYPEGTELVYSNFTPRSNKHAPHQISRLVSFGQQMAMRTIDDMFYQHFFSIRWTDLEKELRRELSAHLFSEYDVSHFQALHELGYLPIQVKALPEGEIVPMGIPVLTIENTLPKFYWITNYLETLLSNLMWKSTTSATIAYEYRKILERYAMETDESNIGFVDFQGHDFSMRGMGSLESAIYSGLGHATSFKGSDSIPVIHGARVFYDEIGDVIHSVNATEHSVMSAGTMESEIETFRRLMSKFPEGILSIVSDTWDLWRVLTEYMPKLKDEVLARDGKLVIRPDSGDPVDIICGTGHDINAMMEAEILPYEKGVIELLWDVFGGHVNEQGYKVLNPKIGAIYGDSITLDRAEQICERLKAKGFASTNIVIGVGSFTYQYNTRDSFGFAMKATYCEVNGEGREIYKDPVTDDGTKKSAKGLLCVEKVNGEYKLFDQVSREVELSGELNTIYRNGLFYNRHTLSDIRERLGWLKRG